MRVTTASVGAGWRRSTRRRPGASSARPLQLQRGVEVDLAVLAADDLHAQVAPGRGQAQLVLVIHGHEGRDVEDLVDALAHAAVLAAHAQHVGVALAPRRVGDLGDDRLQALARAVEAVVEADGVEQVAQAAQVGQQPHRAARARAGALGDERADGVGERDLGVAEVVGAAEAHERRVRRRPQPGRADALGDRVEVEVGHEHAVAEAMVDRLQAPVPDPALVERVHAGTRSRMRASARCALATPSS